MSITDKITRLAAAKNAIAAAIQQKSGTVPSGAGFEDFAAAIGTIPSGGSVEIVEGDIVGSGEMRQTVVHNKGKKAIYAKIYCNDITSEDKAKVIEAEIGTVYSGYTDGVVSTVALIHMTSGARITVSGMQNYTTGYNRLNEVTFGQYNSSYSYDNTKTYHYKIYFEA